MQYLAECLCGAIRYEIAQTLTLPRYCHCSICRRFSGGVPGAWALIPLDSLRQLVLDAPVCEFDSGGGIRCFCGECGTPVWFKSKLDDRLRAIPLGILSAGAPEPTMHIWYGSRADWYCAADGLQRFDENPQD